MLEKGEVEANSSGRQELLENLVNRYLDRVLSNTVNEDNEHPESLARLRFFCGVHKV